MDHIVIIASINDLETWIANENPGNVGGDRTTVTRIADAIQREPTRPRWGAEWQEWLDANAERVALAVTP